MNQQTRDHLKKLTEKEQDIAFAVCNYYNILPDDLFGNSRTNKCAIPRFILAYILKNNSNEQTLDGVGKKVRINPLHHTSIVNALKKAETEIQYNKSLFDFVSSFSNKDISFKVNSVSDYNMYKAKGFSIMAFY